MTEYLSTKDSTKCYGCRACEKICSQKAISFEPDEEGFLYPVLSEDLCVNCGLCKKVCPYDNDFSGVEPCFVYALRHKNEEILLNSSSGGAFSLIADYVIEKGGAVCGCVFDEEFRAVHIVTEDESVIEKMRGSKYVQSDTADAFTEIKSRLEKGQAVLFTGTPCQVDGLKHYLRKDYENLLTVDLICHGVPSPLLLNEYIKTVEDKKGRITDIKFRDKKNNGWRSEGTITCENKKEYVFSPFRDSYYNLYYVRNNVSRMSCYCCKYATQKRVGDFTIGDYWNIPDVVPELDYEKGVSVILANNQKAQGIIREVKDSVVIYETELSAAVKGNGNLSRYAEMPDSRKNIYKKILKNGFEKTAKEERKFSYVVPFIKRHMPKGIKKYLKKFVR